MLKLNPGEKIHLIKRRHRIILKLQLLPFALVLLLILFAILILFFKEITWFQFLVEKFPQLLEFRLKFILIFFLSLFLPVLWAVIFTIITYYYLTYWVVTNQRTIYVKLNGFFNVDYVSVSHDRIQDITISIKGVFASVFRFGDLQIQTAGEMGKFVFDSISEPELIKQVIFEIQKDYSSLKENKKT